jgi:hypothetical protein
MKIVGKLLTFARNNKLKILLAIVCMGALSFILPYVIAFAVITHPTNARDNNDPAKKQEMLKITLDVGDLAKIPNGATIKLIKTDGNMFARNFYVEFNADAKTVKKWLSDSNGIGSAKSFKAGKTTQYIIKARRGWQYAEVIIDQRTNNVSIRVASS